jgi:hypothetical protein
MPEGDTIFRSARALNRALAGRAVIRFDTGLAPLASVNDDTPSQAGSSSVSSRAASGSSCIFPAT